MSLLPPLYNQLSGASQEIRLIEVSPYTDQSQNAKATINCSMSVVSLEDPRLKYNAVSYVWGEPAITEPIILNGHAVKVTSNLHAFLVLYRDMLSTDVGSVVTRYPLWIDALCINQIDVEERNEQTEMMGVIYTMAQRTLAWLGEGDENTTTFLKTIPTLAPLITSSVEPTGWLHADQKLLWNIPKPKAVLPFWEGIFRVMRNPYWHRAWVMQELVLSRATVLLCGKTLSPLSALWTFSQAMRQLRGQLCPSFVDPKIWRVVATEHSDFFTLCLPLGVQLHLRSLMSPFELVGVMPDTRVFQTWEAFVIQCVYLKATDPRDKLYCLAGFTYGRVRTDYTLSVEDVYTDFAERSLIGGRSLELLLFAGHFSIDTEHRPEGPGQFFVPSWAPNWDKLSHATKFSWLWDTNRARGGGKADVGLSSAIITNPANPARFGKVLQVSGVGCSDIKFVRSCNLIDGSWLDFCVEIQSLWADNLEETSIPVAQGLARLLFLDKSIRGRIPLPSQGERMDSVQSAALIHEVARGFLFTLNLCTAWEIEESGATGDPAEREASVRKTMGIEPGFHELRTFFNSATYELTVGRQSPEEREEMRQAIGGSVSGEFGPLLNLLWEARPAMQHYVAIITSTGRLGWARPGISEKDRVVVLQGCPMPVILRQVDETHHILMGPCFIVGLMNGEAAEAVKAGHTKAEEFRIL